MVYFCGNMPSQWSLQKQAFVLVMSSTDQLLSLAREKHIQGMLQEHTVHEMMGQELLADNGIPLVNWINGLPEEVLEPWPCLGLMYVQLLLCIHQYERAENYLQMIECRLDASDPCLSCIVVPGQMGIAVEPRRKEDMKAVIAVLRTYLHKQREFSSHCRQIFHDFIRLTRAIIAETGLTPEPSQMDGPPTASEPLSKREMEVLRCMAMGMSNEEIAQAIVVTVGTVKRHANNIYSKLNVHTRLQAVVYAQTHNIL